MWQWLISILGGYKVSEWISGPWVKSGRKSPNQPRTSTQETEKASEWICGPWVKVRRKGTGYPRASARETEVCPEHESGPSKREMSECGIELEEDVKNPED
jgi:hypothetical protein